MVLRDPRDILALMDRLDSPDQLHRLDPLDVPGHKESPAGQLAQVRLEQRVEPVLPARLDRPAQALLVQLVSPASLDSLGLPELLASQDRLDSLARLDLPDSRALLAVTLDGLASLVRQDVLDLLVGLGQPAPDSQVQLV
jgi:hypothetical protein